MFYYLPHGVKHLFYNLTVVLAFCALVLGVYDVKTQLNRYIANKHMPISYEFDIGSYSVYIIKDNQNIVRDCIKTT